ncbi:hypothetical protein [uncultured Chryseobacterium sp.]|nr:hypothetical protein [uncultured Chryseobacterium sp.]
MRLKIKDFLKLLSTFPNSPTDFTVFRDNLASALFSHRNAISSNCEV